MTRERFVQIMNECGITDIMEISKCWVTALKNSGIARSSTPEWEVKREKSLRRSILEIYIPNKKREQDRQAGSDLVKA